eukprot:jgi/Phyca11/509455/fgenesh2_kg.PHYCAscaffold_46_\
MEDSRVESFVRDDPEMVVLDENDSSTHAVEEINEQRADGVEFLVTVLADNDIELS